MTKSKKKNGNRQVRVRNMAGRQVPRPGVPRGVLDEQARQYAQLLADPCNAKLTQSVFPGAGGSFVGRFETDFIVGNTAAATGLAVVWTPGFTAGPQGCLANSVEVTTDATGFNLSAPQASPGASFLATTDQYRAIAGCLEVYWPGSELNRQGIVGLGLVDSAIVNTFSAGNLATTSALRTLCQHTERMPTEKATINWRPGDFDQTGLGTASSSLLSGRQSILITANGLPVATGVRLRLVVVVEWWPKAGTGLVSTVPQVTTRVSTNDVLYALDRTGNWLINTYKRARPLLEGVAKAVTYGAKMAGPALLALA